MVSNPQFSSEPLSKAYKTINGKRMAYHEAGQGDTVILLHGNPTSSYLWRNILSYLTPSHRCIAPDLMGHGDSDKLDDTGPHSYRFVEHRAYLDGLLSQLNLGTKVTLVLHDWGSALGFDWARRNAERIEGIVYMEALVCPINWTELEPGIRRVFQGFRSEAGEAMIIEKNIFVDRVLPRSVQRGLTEAELTEYRRPFLKPSHRRPTLSWPREIPIDGEPADVTEIVQDYGRWLSECDIPKLFINAEPGSMLVGAQREFCRTWPNQREVTVPGIHFIQEDSPHEIGEAIVDWLSSR